MQLAQLARRYKREFGSQWGGTLDDYFGLAYLERTFHLSLEQARRQLLTGDNSTGLGAFHFNAENRTLYLLVFHCGDNPLGFQPALKQLAEEGLPQIFTEDGDPGSSLALQQVRSVLLENRHSIDQVLLRCVFAGDREEAHRSELLKKLNEDISSKRHLLEKFFGRNVDFLIDWRSAEDGSGLVQRAYKTHTLHFGIVDHVRLAGPNGEQILLGFVPLLDVLRAHQEMGLRFLERNIRFGLGNRKYVNQVLRRAFQQATSDGETTARLFVFHHNGITLAAEAEAAIDGGLSLTEPRLLNGVQTLTTFREFTGELKASGRYEDAAPALERLMVPCKVILGCKPEFVTTVTINNNRQTPVEPWQLRANDEIQISLQDKFRSELGLYYERQAGAFRSLDDQMRSDLGLIESSRAIEMRRLAQTFLVAEGRLSRAKNLREVFQQDEQYAEVFNEQRLRADAHIIVLCYKTQFRLRRIGNALAEMARKYDFAPRARPLIWALLCQAMLNSNDLEHLKEEYGEDLVVPDEFVNYLESTARKFVKPLIARALADGKVAQAQEEEADFLHHLNSDRTFRNCMKAAEESWGWKTRKLV